MLLDILFHKSVLFGARAYLYATLGEFPGSYNDIANMFVLNFVGIDEKYIELVRKAMLVRAGGELDELSLFTNISFLNKLVLPKVEGMKE